MHENTAWEVLTALSDPAERLAAEVLMSEKNAFLRVLQPSRREEPVGQEPHKEEIQRLLNRAEEVISISESTLEDQEETACSRFVLDHSDILFILGDGDGPLGSGFQSTHGGDRKRPLVYLRTDKKCQTVYENLEVAFKQDHIKGDFSMYRPKPIDTSHIELSEEILDLTELLAQNAHSIWAAERMKEGWTYGPERDDGNKKHPDLIPYSELPGSEKEYDRKMSVETLKAIRALGYRIEKENL